MSGIVGILHLDGAPIDRALLNRMTSFLTFRGPDARSIWVNGNVGFGHTLLRATEESEHEHQPFTLDGHVWIVADARVDAQADLIAKLTSRDEHVEHRTTDVELLLHAYHVWGEDCVEHLLGDFAFAVWDGPKRRLFCARDHLGVKPFFYAQLGSAVIFSNTLDCIRQHPGVSDNLNDLAIADFLLFDLNQDPATTTFADIQRIPPAHRARWSDVGRRIDRYWNLPIDEPVFLKKADDYVEQFTELLDVAVSDRLRTNKIALFMSGGLDSPALAATTCKILRSRSSVSEVRAFTSVIEGFDGNERHYAGLVAERLGIRIHFRDRNAKLMDSKWNETEIHKPEPVGDPPNLIADLEEYRLISGYSRVLLYGEGPDNALLYEWKPYLSYLTSKWRFGRLAADVCGHIMCHRRIPLLPTIPRMLKEWVHRDRWQGYFPKWLDDGFKSRMRLRDRWDQQERSSPPLSDHPLRPKGFRSFHAPLWEALFRSMDAGETTLPIEARHPFVDLRLLRYMLAIPAIPWCREKYLVRRAMRQVLPEAVLRRPKSPLTSDPVWEGIRRSGLPPLRPVSELCEYVDCEYVPKDAGANMMDFRVNFRPFALNYWLQNLRRQSRDITKEMNNEVVTNRAG